MTLLVQAITFCICLKYRVFYANSFGCLNLFMCVLFGILTYMLLHFDFCFCFLLCCISKEGRFFLALPNGTIYFMNKSTKPQWELLIGQPLSYSWRSPSNDDPDYIVFSDSNGELYEYSKDAGIRVRSRMSQCFLLCL